MFYKLVVFLAMLVLGALALPDGSRTYEDTITMTDGTRTHARIVLPSGYDGTQKYTTILDRSPYGYGDLEWIPDIFVPFGFVTVGNDVRGTAESEGEFSIFHETEDDFDAGEWITKQEWSNGEVFTFGASADGITSLQTLWSEPEYLKAQYIVWATTEFYEAVYPQGAYRQSLVDNWIRGTVPDQSEECLETIRENEWFAGNDWWSPLEYTNKYDLIKNPMAWWCGYYDIFTQGCIAGFEGSQYYSAEGARGKSLITIDPLGHCQSAADFFQPHLIAGRTLLPIAQALQLYGVRDVSRDFKAVTFYVMSSSDDAGNFWTTLDDFPRYREAAFYLQEGGVLSTSASGSDGSTTYVHDPADPVPSQGGNNLEIPCGPLDQQEVEARDDNIVFTTPVLEEDLVLSGPMWAKLFVSSDAVDTDFMVKISDVLPSGESRLLMDNAFRMRWREMKSEPTNMEAGEVYEIDISLWNTSYVFPAGNQLRVSISSSNYPRFSINPNNGRMLKDEDFTQNVTATNTIYHSSEYASRIVLPKVSRAQLPEFHLIEAFEKNFPEFGSAKEVISKFGHIADDLVERSLPKKDWRREFASRANKMGGKWF